MGDVHGTRTTQELVPHFNWIEDSVGHYLLVHLPGFEKEDVMVGVAYPGYVTISGERTANDEKSIYFGQALKLPDNLDMNKMDQSFEDETLCLTFPKRIVRDEKDHDSSTTAEKHSAEEVINIGENQREYEGDCHPPVNEEQSKISDNHVIDAHDGMRNEEGTLERAIKLLNNNMAVTFVLAFSLGVLVSRWFGSNMQSGLHICS
ncbi:putative HSP20-like chaperones superfamily protein [Hibiscus syriacus]|uniref:HSP20-like chaperones superfamily protein n=1 Tax=Hibiscus syriacus TaxID=106335 RepID=A0A6A2WN52_HIBSY|nr:uncharacterized protein LOC120187242 [Hibiscus syriacus]KAE8661783.1 putative HSP20-like chaperones superfamily protein [Hibiscus syriacus]